MREENYLRTVYDIFTTSAKTSAGNVGRCRMPNPFLTSQGGRGLSEASVHTLIAVSSC